MPSSVPGQDGRERRRMHQHQPHGGLSSTYPPPTHTADTVAAYPMVIPPLKVSVNTVPLSRSSVRVPFSCSVNVKISCNPKVSALGKSSSLGKPIPVSDTTRVTCCAASTLRSMRISPLRPVGKACFNALQSSSLRIKPHGVALLTSN